MPTLKSAIELKNPVFISDIHISTEGHEKAFCAFLKTTATRYSEVVILGDFFDAWPGDEKLAKFPALIKDLASFTQNRPVYVMHGNRDFMLGNTFVNQTDVTLIDDPCVAKIGNLRFLLSHGDIWCTKDIRYQKLRRVFRSKAGETFLRLLPYGFRQKIARDTREKSAREKTLLADDITDVVSDAIDLKPYGKIDAVIHGHTHKPALHQLTSETKRVVLPDWRFEEDSLIQWGYADICDDGPNLCIINS